MIINNIDTKDISVVVQGAIDKVNTPICLKSIRKYLPGAEIILSTWKGSEIDGLDYDILVLNEDPGNCICDEVYKVYNNVNRQIVSTKNGLKKATKKYAIKIRSDMEIIGTGFLNYFGKFKKRCEECKILKERVIINNLYCRNPNKIPLLFHPSDWFFFGLTEDILNIWDIPLSNNDNFCYFKNKSRPEIDIFPTWLQKYSAEQYIWVSFLKKNNIMFNFNHYTDINVENSRLSEISLVNNLIIMDYKSSELKFLKYNPSQHDIESVYSYFEWLELYKKYCDKNYRIPLKYIIKNDLRVQKSLKKFKKHWKNFFQPTEKILKNFFKWFGEFFAVFFYGVKIIFKTERIKKRDITFVVSGKVDYNSIFNTISCLKSIRKYFANSKIILSTWQDSDLSKLDSKLYDEIVFSNQDETEILDVGYHIGDIAKNDARKNSYNLQQLLNKKGFDLVKTKYAVKFRTDLVLKSDNFLKFYNKNINLFDKVDTKYKLFKNRILIGDYWTVDSRTFFNNIQSFQISDIFQFGLTDDLKKIWDGNVMDYDTANYFKDHPNSELFNPTNFNHLFNLEQFNILSVIRKSNLNLILPTYYADNREEVVNESEKFISSNFLINTFDKLNIDSKFNSICVSNLFNYKRFIEIYLLHIDQKNENIKNIYKSMFIKEKIKKLLKQFKKHWKNCFQPLEKIVKRFFKWSGEFFAILFYGVKVVLKVLCSFWK